MRIATYLRVLNVNIKCGYCWSCHWKKEKHGLERNLQIMFIFFHDLKDFTDCLGVGRYSLTYIHPIPLGSNSFTLCSEHRVIAAGQAGRRCVLGTACTACDVSHVHCENEPGDATDLQ